MGIVWPKTSHCLVHILVQTHNWIIFLRKWSRSDRYSQWRSLWGHVGYYMASRVIPFKWNYFPLLTGRIVFPNKRNLRSYLVDFLSIFRKKVFWWTLNYVYYVVKMLPIHVSWSKQHEKTFFLIYEYISLHLKIKH